jgi:hypothetical protein
MLKWVVSNGVACRSWQEMTKQWISKTVSLLQLERIKKFQLI